MTEEFYDLKNKFNEIKNLGWIEGNKKDPGSIGTTFEILIGKPKENFSYPDYKGIELKVKTIDSKSSFTTLFNKTPEGNEFFEIKDILKNYGYPDKKNKEYKIFNGEVSSKEAKFIGLNYQFELFVNYDAKKINLLVFNRQNELIDNTVYWNFNDLKETLYIKFKYLAYIKAKRKFIKDKIYFKYETIDFYELKDFDNFIKLIECGKIKVLFRIGVFREGKRVGQIHDRGTAFQIEESALLNLFNKRAI